MCLMANVGGRRAVSRVWFSTLFMLAFIFVSPALAWNLPLPGGGRVAYEGGLLRIRGESAEDLPNMPHAEATMDPLVLRAIEIRDTKTIKGFGAYAIKELPKHTFLGFYEGIPRASLAELENTEYIMSLDGGATY